MSTLGLVFRGAAVWMASMLMTVLGCLFLLWRYLINNSKQFRQLESPTFLTNNKFGEHKYIQLKNDITLHYVECGAEAEELFEDDMQLMKRNGKSKKSTSDQYAVWARNELRDFMTRPLLLLLHGVPDFWYTWRCQLGPLSKHYRVVAVDLRGCGESDKPLFRTSYRANQIVDDLALLIPALGATRAHVVCAGSSGSLGWRLAEKHSHLVAKLVLLHLPHPSIVYRHLASGWRAWAKYWWMWACQQPWVTESVAIGGDVRGATYLLGHLAKERLLQEEDVAAYKYNFRNFASWRGSVHHIRQSAIDWVTSAANEDTPRQPPISTPTLLLMATKDATLPLDLAYRSAEHVERVTVRPVQASSGRWMHVTAAEEVNGVILEFLREMPWKPLNPLSSSIMGRVVGAGLAAVSRTGDVVEGLTSLRSIQNKVASGLRMAETSLGLDNLY